MTDNFDVKNHRQNVSWKPSSTQSQNDDGYVIGTCNYFYMLFSSFANKWHYMH